MTIRWFVPLIAGLGIAISSGLAQGPGGPRRYDPRTETAMKGTVKDVEEVRGMRGGSTGTHLIVKTDAGDMDVHVGPSSYVSGRHFSFAKGDAVEVVGSKVTLGSKEVILAREITKEGKTLVLRNAQGIPEWSSTRRGNY